MCLHKRALYLVFFVVWYINDIVKILNPLDRLFAYDTSLLVTVDNPTTDVVCLNSDIA